MPVFPSSTSLIISVPLILTSLPVTNRTLRKLVNIAANEEICSNGAKPAALEIPQILGESRYCDKTGATESGTSAGVPDQLWAITKQLILP